MNKFNCIMFGTGQKSSHPQEPIGEPAKNLLASICKFLASPPKRKSGCNIISEVNIHVPL